MLIQWLIPDTPLGNTWLSRKGISWINNFSLSRSGFVYPKWLSRFSYCLSRSGFAYPRLSQRLSSFCAFIFCKSSRTAGVVQPA